MTTMTLSGLSLAIDWIGAYLINAAAMTEKLTLFSNMVVFSSYAMQVIMAFVMMVMIFIMLPRAAVSARRINEVLDTEPTIRDGHATEGKPGMEGEIAFRHVSFRYPGAADYVLHDVSFQVHQGETVAFIGSTGSGKSTLINLVPRFFDVTEGEVLVDGVNVKDYKEEALYNKIGYVPQKAVLFKGTVASNVGYGDNGREEPTEEDMPHRGADRTGRGLCRKDGGPVSRRYLPGRHQRVGRAEATPGHRPGGLPKAGNLYL